MPFLPVTFEGGLYTKGMFSSSASEHPQGPPNTLRTLNNWEPTPMGGLRARPGWTGEGATTNRPSTFGAHGMGWYPKSSQILIANADSSSQITVRTTDVNLSGYTVRATHTSLTDALYPVSFATGLGLIVYNQRYLGFSRKWDGSTEASTTGPSGNAIAFHLERFWSGGNTSAPSRLYFSAIGSATSWDTTNDFIDIDSDSGGTITATLPTREGLLVGKTTGLYLLIGRTKATFERVKIADTPVGGTTPSPMVETPYGVCFTTEGVGAYLWAGGQPERLNDNLSLAVDGGAGSLAYIGDKLYSSGGSRIFVYDFQLQSWRREIFGSSSTFSPTVLGVASNALYGAMSSASSFTYAAKQDVTTVTDSSTDASGTGSHIAFTAESQWITPEGPKARCTFDKLHVRVRQRGNTGGSAALQAFFDVDDQASSGKTVPMRATSGLTYEDVGIGLTGYGINITFSQSWTGAAPTYDVESCVLEYQVENPL